MRVDVHWLCVMLRNLIELLPKLLKLLKLSQIWYNDKSNIDPTGNCDYA